MEARSLESVFQRLRPAVVVKNRKFHDSASIRHDQMCKAQQRTERQDTPDIPADFRDAAAEEERVRR